MLKLQDQARPPSPVPTVAGLELRPFGSRPGLRLRGVCASARARSLS
jgi:hypothetical protein